MRLAILILTLFSVAFAGIFAVMTSTLLQSVAVLLIGVSCIIAAVSRYDLRIGGTALVISSLGFIYFNVRALTSPVFDLGLGDLFLLLPATGVFLIYVSGCISRKHFFWGFASVVMLLGMLNVVMFIPPVNTWRDAILPFARGDMDSGLYNHRNFCGNLLMMSILISSSVALWLPNLRWKRWLFIMIAGCCLVGMIFASARGGFIGLVAGFIFIACVYFMLAKMSVRQRLLMSGLSLVVGVMIVIGGAVLLDKRGVNVEESVDLGGRTNYFSMAIDQVFDAPFVGSGSMSHSYLSYKYWGDMHTHKQDHVWVHNEFLQTLTDYGFVGLFLLLTFLCCCFWSLANGMMYTGKSENIASVNYLLKLTGAAVMVGFLVNSFVSFPAHAQPNFMVFAFASALVISRKSGGSGEKEEGKRLCVMKNSLVRILFLIIGGSSIALGYKEIRALQIFSSHHIYEDISSWKPADHLNDGWYEAYNKVVEVSPDYRRYGRLASLLLEKVTNEPKPSVRESMLIRALELSNFSLERHPYYAASLANKITCLQGLGRYEEAIPYNDQLIKNTKYRKLFFDPVNKKLVSLLGLAKHLAAEGDYEESERVYNTAYETIYAPAVHRRPRPDEIVTSIVIGRAGILLHLEKDEELEVFWEDFYNKRFHRLLRNLSDPNLLYAHGRLILAYADRAFLSRKPGVAYKWYNLALRCYRQISEDSLTAQMIDDEDYIVSKIKFLKTAKIKPSK